MSAQARGTELHPLAIAFQQGLAEHSWINGKNVIIEYKKSGGSLEKSINDAKELLASGVDLIVASGANSYDGARQVTDKTPIVFCAHGDPIGVGHAKTLSRPGGNMTGLSFYQAGLSNKKVDLLLTLAPQAKNMGVLWDPSPLIARSTYQSICEAAQAWKLNVVSAEIRSGSDFRTEIENLRANADVVFVIGSPLIYFNSEVIIGLINKSKLPSILPFLEMSKQGALLVYAPDMLDLFRRCGGYVDRILKGADPAKLPIEQPNRYRLIVNLKTAQEIGISIPSTVLAMADQIID